MAVIEGTGEVVIKRQPEILEDIISKQQELIDPNINNRSDGVLSENNNIIAQLAAELNEFIESVRDCWDIYRAEGFALDNLLALKKVRRIQASKSYTDKQVFVGNNGVTIPQGRVIKNVNNGDEFYTTSKVELSNRACRQCFLEIIEDPQEGDRFVVTINEVVAEYVAVLGDTKEDVILQLISIADTLLLDRDERVRADFTDTGEYLFVALSESGDTQLDVTYSSNLKVYRVVNYGVIESVEYGPIPMPNFSVREFVLPVVGVIETYNLGEGILGRYKESDEEFRERGINTSLVEGVGTTPAIEASLVRNVEGVGSAIVIENDTGYVDVDGRPPHSFETVVVGGDDTAVAEDLLRTKPASIPTVGSTTVIVKDQNGVNRSISFTRPTAVEVSVRVRYSVYNEEVFPVNGASQIQSVVVEYINNLGLNEDIIPNRILGPVYNEVSGIDELTIEVDAGSGFTTSRIPISISEYAYTTELDVDVAEI